MSLGIIGIVNLKIYPVTPNMWWKQLLTAPLQFVVMMGHMTTFGLQSKSSNGSRHQITASTNQAATVCLSYISPSEHLCRMQ